MVWLIFTIITASITLCLCWWPFNFWAKNDVLVVPEQGKAFFNMGLTAPSSHNRGHAFTRDTITFDSNRGASFHFLLTPSERPRGLGCILTLHDGGKHPPLVIAQWQEHLELFVREPKAEKGYREVSLRDQLKPDTTISLTIVTTATETSVFVDGQPMAHYAGFSLLADHGQTTGQILLGNNQHGTESWRGSIQRMAIYDQASITSFNYLPVNQPIIDYRFGDYKNETVSNQEQTSYSLSVLARFTPLKPIFLAPLARNAFNRLDTWQDMAFNIMGFIPISICLAVFSGRVQSEPLGQFFLTIMLAFFFSLIIESVQVVLPSRHSSQLDLLCNTLGGVLVASVFWISNRKALSPVSICSPTGCL